MKIGIITLKDDLHAYLVKYELQKFGNVQCYIFDTDSISGKRCLTWSNTDQFTPVILSTSGEEVEVPSLDLIWWRRCNQKQRFLSDMEDPAEVEAINNDILSTLLGLCLNEFRGVWINDPRATTLSENKLIQLKAAQYAGFKVPKTLVTQDPTLVREFYNMMNGKLIVKPVKGTNLRPLFSQKVVSEHLESNHSLQYSPAIYQEHIEGNQHLRIHCFGDEVIAVSISSKDLDWRKNLNVPIKVHRIEESLETCLRKLLTLLGLRMGVVDCKIRPDGEIIWLEINPQGQFLFVEGIADVPLAEKFAEFLYREMRLVA